MSLQSPLFIESAACILHNIVCIFYRICSLHLLILQLIPVISVSSDSQGLVLCSITGDWEGDRVTTSEADPAIFRHSAQQS